MRVRYALPAIVLHWLIAALVLTNIALGWAMARATGLNKFELFQLHKSVGITVLLLSVARTAWRLTHSPPPWPAEMSRLERATARAVHGAFYVLMIALPMTGWVVVSASRYNLPTVLFGTMPWPHLGFIHAQPLAQREMLAGSLGGVHAALALSMVALVVLHVAAALKHQFLDRDRLLLRMVPFSRLESRP